MRRIPALSCTLLLALACGTALAEDAVPPSSRAEIRRVISAQIEAFRRRDGAAALAFAAPGIVQRFGDGPHFLEMVRTAYPAVYAPRSFSFGEVSSDGGVVEQKVEFVGSDGSAALGIYDMEHEADGSWRISGCMLEQSERIDL